MRRLIILAVFALCIVPLVLGATRTLYVEEGDFVTLIPEGYDADQDKISYNFTEPLDSQGEWQTTFEDAGEYNITITASDGKNVVSEIVNLVVKEGNQPPTQTKKKITVKEGEVIDLKTLVEDKDGDALTFSAKNFKDGKWTTDYEDAGEKVIDFTIDDGEYKVKGRIEITILETNQPPTIKKIFSEKKELDFKEGDTFKFFAELEDKDSKVKYIWRFDGKNISDKSSDELSLNYDTSGEHILQLVGKDEENSVQKEWKIVVENVNRKPTLELKDITIKEGELLQLGFPQVDADGDKLQYTFEKPLNDKGEWQTGFDDVGKYKLDVEVTDGKLKDKDELLVVVEDVDRAPEVKFPKRLYVSEEDTITWKIEASDPDGDRLTYELVDPPAGSKISKEIFSWKPGYDAIKRSGGIFSKVLNTLRLEHYLLKDKEFQLKLKVCGKELCREGTVPILVYNVNRKPEFESISPNLVLETAEIDVNAVAHDPDGDIVHYYFSKPLSKRTGKWKTDYGDAGVKEVKVTATDGRWGNTATFNITVLRKNQRPTLKPSAEEMTVKEGQEVILQINAEDPDSNNVTVTLEDIPKGASFKDGVFRWTPGYDEVSKNSKSEESDSSFADVSNIISSQFSGSEKVVWLKFTVSDEEFDVIHPIKIVVKNKNRKPKIVDYLPVGDLQSEVGESLIFSVAGTDPDKDNLTYTWAFDFGQKKVTGSNTIERTYVLPGVKKVSVEIDDGLSSITKKWMILVRGEVEESIEMEEDNDEISTNQNTGTSEQNTGTSTTDSNILIYYIDG